MLHILVRNFIGPAAGNKNDGPLEDWANMRYNIDTIAINYLMKTYNYYLIKGNGRAIENPSVVLQVFNSNRRKRIENQ